MLKLLSDAAKFQYIMAKATGHKPKFRFDPVSEASEISLLKDFIGQPV